MGDGVVVEEELRFAVVLNGGVSLAIWMGGAVHELDRLTHGSRPSVDQDTGESMVSDGERRRRRSGKYYPKLLQWAVSTARVDVISGTSAGGINGAALALSQCNRSKDAGTLHLLRDVWLDSGRLQSLMRPPLRSSAASLLQGDEFFLPQMNHALRRLVKHYESQPVETYPMDLTITATLLRGIPGAVTGYAGQQVGQTRHDGLFRFRRGPTHPNAGSTNGEANDDFSNERIEERPVGIIDALALAARTTASYPMAFEPSYLPVSDPVAANGTSGRILRPNVEPYLSGAWDQSQGAVKRARFAADGGLLANTPTRPAMEAVDAMPASGPVRRVLLLVHPHAPAIIADSDDELVSPPTLVSTGSSLLKAITSEGSRNFTNLVEEHNRMASGQRAMRADVVGRLPPTLDAPDVLHDEAVGVYGLYRRRRLRAAAHHLATLWVGRRRPSAGALEDEHRSTSQQRPDPSRTPTVASTRRQILECLGAFTRGGAPAPAPSTAAIPEGAPTSGPILPFLPPEVDGLPGPGQLGFEGALGIADAAVDYLRRAMWWAATNDTELADRVCQSRARVSIERNRIMRRRRNFDAKLIELASARHGDRLDSWLDEALMQHARLCTELTEPLANIGEAVEFARVDRAAVHDLPMSGPAEREDHDNLRDFAVALFVPIGPLAPGAVLERLSLIHLLTYAVSDETLTGNTLPIDLVQLTYQVEHPFADNLASGEAKVAGDLVGRFGGFLKRSWRMNDWTWGRLDAARVLCQTVLEPSRVRRYLQNRGRQGLTPYDLAAELLTDIAADPAVRARLQLPSVDDLGFELAQVLEGAEEELALLPAVFATALALEIAAEELPELPIAVDFDIKDGGWSRSKGALSVGSSRDLYEAAGDPTNPSGGWIGLERFAASGLGQESLTEEASSDQLIMTATTAAATTISMLDGERSGLTKLKPLTRTLRGAALVPYWIVRGLTDGNKLARSLAQLTMAFGAVLVVLGLLGAGPVWATSVGIGVLLAAFAYAALRSGTMIHGIVLLIPALIVLTLTLPGIGEDGTDGPGAQEPSPQVTDGEAAAATQQARQEESVTVVAAAITLVLGLFVLGSLSPPVADPATWWRQRHEQFLAWLKQLERSQKSALVLLGGLVVAGSLVLVVPAARQTVWSVLTGMSGAVRAAAALSGLVLAGMAGARLAWLLREDTKVLDLVAQGPDTYIPVSEESPGTDAATAGWSVVYGIVAAALAVATWRWPVAGLGAVVPGALGIAGLLLLAVVPWRLRQPITKEMQRRARDAFGDASLPDDASELAKLEVLFVNDLNVGYLMKPKGNRPTPAPGAETVGLTPAAARAFRRRSK